MHHADEHDTVPSQFWEAQCTGVDEVSALPCGLELLFKVEERLVFFRVAKAPGQKINTIAKKRLFFSICVAEWCQAQTSHLEAIALHIF